jgi:hypothetical protein
MTWLKAGLLPSYKVKGSRTADLAADSGIDLAVDSAVGLDVTQPGTRQSVQEL